MAKENEKETTQETTQAAVPEVPQREDIYIPRGYANDEPFILVGINGVNYKLPRGKTSNVPAAVAAEIRRSLKAQEQLDKTVSELLEQSK